MKLIPSSNLGRRAASATSLALGLLLGAAMPALWATRIDAAAPPTAIDRLVAEDAIRQQIALYGLLADGDGVQPKDLRRLADTIVAPDGISEVVNAVGATISHTAGRDELVGTTPSMPPNLPTVGRHYLIATYFDELTATSAKTRTTSLYVNVTRNVIGAGCEKAGLDACGGRVVRAVLFVYHDSWVKTPSGWQKTLSVLRRDS